MDDSERDEILWRLDERTEAIQTHVREVKEVNLIQREAIDRNRRLAEQNRTILNGLTFGLGTLVTTALAKFGGLIKF